MKSIRPSVAVAASTTAQPPVPWLFFGLLGLGGLAACAGYAALVLSTATWTEARALDALFPYLNWHLAAFTAAEFQQLHRGLAATALALAAVGLGLGVGTRPGRRELAATGRALVAASQRLRTPWRVLPRRQRWLAGGLLLGLTIVRTYLSTSQLPWGDDVVSYELFVRQRLLAVSAYYPMPTRTQRAPGKTTS